MAGGLEPGLRDEGHIIGLGAGDWINLIASLLERFPHIILCLGHLKENMSMTKLSVNARTKLKVLKAGRAEYVYSI